MQAPSVTLRVPPPHIKLRLMYGGRLSVSLIITQIGRENNSSADFFVGATEPVAPTGINIFMGSYVMQVTFISICHYAFLPSLTSTLMVLPATGAMILPSISSPSTMMERTSEPVPSPVK